jgi:hypothetical protein
MLPPDEDPMEFFGETEAHICLALSDLPITSVLPMLVTTLAAIVEVLAELPPHVRASVARTVNDQLLLLFEKASSVEKEGLGELMDALCFSEEQRRVEAAELEIFIDDIVRN